MSPLNNILCTKQWLFSVFLCRKWRNPKPTTSWCCSATPGASSGRCTPTAPRPRRSPSWPASGQGASPPRWSRACTSTTRTGSSSARSQPKPCPLAWTPSPSPVICGKPRSRGRPKNCTPSSSPRPRPGHASPEWTQKNEWILLYH